MAESKEWIVRFYANHDSIPEGHHDGEIVRELIRCKDCKNKQIKDNVWTCPFGFPAGCDFYCGYGERRTE